MKLSKRVMRVEPSATLAMTARAKALIAKGVPVLTMSAGEPDFDTPDNIKAAAVAAMNKGDSKYTPVAGSVALRKAVAQWTEQVYGWQVKPEQVIVGTGGKQVLFNACAALLDPGDEALVPSPYWVSYPDMIRFADAVPVMVYADESKGFLPQAADLKAAITAKTRLLILNSPSNPTGATYTRAQLEEIAALLRQHPEIFVITDDIYGGLVYDAPFVSLAHVAPDLKDRILIAAGASKTYAMTGWRIGFGIGPQALISAMTDLQGASTSGACSIAQAAAVEAISGNQSAIEAMRVTFKKRRDRIVEGLRTIPDLGVMTPPGAFYVFPRVTKYLGGKVKNTSELCEHLLENAHIALVPGSAFGSEDHIRLSFACSDAEIDEAVARIRKGLAMLR